MYMICKIMLYDMYMTVWFNNKISNYLIYVWYVQIRIFASRKQFSFSSIDIPLAHQMQS